MKSAVINICRCVVPRRLREAIVHFGFNLEVEEFLRFANLYAYAPDMKAGLQALRRLGVDARTIVDVGAFKGGWSGMAREVWPDSNISMIEPQTEMLPELRRKAEQLGAHLHEALLGAEDGKEIEFVIMQSGSSVFEEQSEVPRRREMRTLRTLDRLLPDLPQIDVLKIDAEGYELEILRGAESSLRKTGVVLLEVSLIPTNHGAPLVHEVLEFMKDREFVAYDIVEFHRRPIDRALSKIDIVFVKEFSELRRDHRHSGKA